MDELMNLIRREAERAVRAMAAPRGAIVSSYDPTAHAVKVTDQVTGAESNWMPVKHAAVGAGWGLICGAPIGAQAVVEYLNGDINCPFVSGFLNSTPDTPQTVPSGEIWLQHQSGSLVRLAGTGHVTLTDASGSVIDMQNNGTITVNAAAILLGGPA
jgi:uncharacterized protein involved in type VI secretion and phage assembly